MLAMLASVGGVMATEVHVTVTEAGSSTPPVVRMRLRDRVGRDCLPAGAQRVAVGRDQWFVAAGEVAVDVPPGLITVRIERGTEYHPIRRQLQVPDSGSTRFAFEITRWINLRERGYVCGEDHLHVPPAELAPQIVAEGLDYGTILQWWNGPKIRTSPTSGFIGDLEFAGRRVPASLYDVEIEHEWGAVYLIGQPRPLEAGENPRRPNLPVVRQAHEAGALVCYQGGWSQEVLVDALLGLVDVVEVCNNNFARHHFQPRSRYSNLLNVPGLPTYPDTPEGMMKLNTDTYYRLLNCGLRLAAGAGTATGPKMSPVGYNRAYVRADAKSGLPGFLAGWKQGRNFVTNGPALFLKINGRQEPGDQLDLPAGGGEVEFALEAASEQPLTSLELIVNGEVRARAGQLERTSGSLSGRVKLEAGSWIAARCTEEDRLMNERDLARFSWGEKGWERRPCRLRFAHTSPVYVTVGGRGCRVPQAMDEATRILDAFEVHARRLAAPQYLEEILAGVREARSRLGR